MGTLSATVEVTSAGLGWTCFWTGVAGFAVIAAVITAAQLRARRRRHVLWPERPDDSWLGRPEPRQIWWADIAFSDGSGWKNRPCLVIRTYRDHVVVLPITSQDKSHRRDHIEIPTARWDPRAEYDSFLNLAEPRALTDRAFTRVAGLCDDGTWAYVGSLHAVGWVVPAAEARRLRA